MKRFKVGMVLFFAVLVAAVPASAGNWYIGGGLDFVSVGDDLDFIDSGAGFAFDFGYRFSPSIALDMSLASSVHEDNGIDVSYGRFAIGPKFIFPGQSFDPFVTVGLMSHVLDYDFFLDEIDGTGLFFGLGADVYFNTNGSMTFSYLTSSWEADHNYWGSIGDAQTGILHIVYVYHFLP